MNAIAEKLHLLESVAPNDALLASMLDKVLGAVADQYRQKLVMADRSVCGFRGAQAV